ncbi:MAG: folylpolyglutamate synthase/dihydrofolate synthase family protein [Chthoniobacterales bacterium]
MLSAAEDSATYRDSLGWLFSTQLFGIKLGLENIERLLGALTLPDKQQRIIHVAGTNGKGSVCAMLDSICRAQGYRIGLFTSPHLVTFRERIQVNGEMISEEAVTAGLGAIRSLICSWDPHPTFFEIVTALALRHFSDERCEIVVLETGMGGRLDATNAVIPVVSVITPISLDHQKWLGDTLGEIAGEKAGIIKAGVPTVSAPQLADAREVISSRAEALQTPLEFIADRDETHELALAGTHQKQNAALARAALRVANIVVSQQAICDGLANVSWPARFQRWSERIVIDGAHNPAGAHALVRTWQELFGDDRATVILAVLRDKDVTAIVEALRPIAARMVLPLIRSERAIPPPELLSLTSTIAPSIAATTATSFETALEKASAETDRILITGSLHFAGEALATLAGTADRLEECLQ